MPWPHRHTFLKKSEMLAQSFALGEMLTLLKADIGRLT